MFLLVKFVYSYYKSDGVQVLTHSFNLTHSLTHLLTHLKQYLFTQFVRLLLCWVKTHLVAVSIEFFLVLTRGIYDHISTRTIKQSLPESADAYQPSKDDLEKIKQYYNGSVKVKIERLHVEVTTSLNLAHTHYTYTYTYRIRCPCLAVCNLVVR